jgi:putative pyruvate formate lyase activating enzyme
MSNSNKRFELDHFEPTYLSAHRRGELDTRARMALEELADCSACPRNCHVNRLQDKELICRTGRHAIVSSAFAHFGEEDCLRGCKGSGTLFFGGCNLRCVFCQNWDISQQAAGKASTAEHIARLMLALQGQGCHNINLVTPEHVAPQVIEALAIAIPAGLRLPVVYNTSAYVWRCTGRLETFASAVTGWPGAACSFAISLCPGSKKRLRPSFAGSLTMCHRIPTSTSWGNTGRNFR